MIRSIASTGGNMPDELQGKAEEVLREFGAIASEIGSAKQIRRAAVRSNLLCSIVAVLDSERLFVAGQSHLGMQTVHYIDLPQQRLQPQDVIDAARWEFGFEDPFLVFFPRSVLDKATDDRRPIIEATASTFVESEYQRMVKMTSLVQINPLFGPASYTLNPNLVFVLMPFTEELTRIYDTIIKPLIEGVTFGMVCRRADDYKTNKAVIQDIWQGICEARIVIADLTTLNPNVMYELGMAHTVGKETILIYLKKRDKIQFPFDLAHIRRIEYVDSATGGKMLENDLIETIRSILGSKTISQS